LSITAGFREDHRCRQGADAGDRTEQDDRGAKGGLTGLDLFIHAGDQAGPAARAEDVGDHPVQLDVGLFQRLLKPLDMADLLAGQLLAGAPQ